MRRDIAASAGTLAKRIYAPTAALGPRVHCNIRVYSGRTGDEIYRFDGSGDEALGARVAILDDLDGDGSCEFLLAAPNRPNGPPTYYSGVVELRSGATAALMNTFALGANTGTAVCRLGDADGDGINDFAISSWIVIYGNSHGTVHVFSGASRQQIWSEHQLVSYDGPSFGYSIASAGDLNQDGLDDIIIGTPGSSVSHGDSAGHVATRSGDGSPLTNGLSLQGYSGWDYLGYSVTGLGDCDGDGRPDLAIGAPAEEENPDLAQAGWNRIHWICSGYLRKYSYCTTMQNSSGRTALLQASGSSSLAVNELNLFVSGAPRRVPLLLMHGRDRVSIPFGGGHLCVGVDLQGLQPVVITSQEGNARIGVLPSKLAGGALAPGSEWSFQAWFREPAAAGPGGFGLSDAVRISFVD